MCHNGTFVGIARVVGVGLFALIAATAQTRPEWRKVGSPAVELSLASAATGPVAQVWFSPKGTELFARTMSGAAFVTSDFETWSLAPRGTAAPDPAATSAFAETTSLPEPGALPLIAAGDPSHIYALGRQLFRSEDGGHSWSSLTQYRTNSIVGSGQHSLAVSPSDSNDLVLANDYGVWRSRDGGLTWAGLNQLLPNLPVRRIVTTPSGTIGTRIETEVLGSLELPAGGSVWLPSGNSARAAEAALWARYSGLIGVPVTAVGASGSTVYAGSQDGRIWVSLDGGASFRLSRTETGGAVERLYVDASEPSLALALLSGSALSGSGPHVLRTTSGGSLWDDLTGNLPEGAVHGITAERSAGAVYVATDRGVFYTRTDLQNATVPTVDWISLNAGLPTAVAWDVKLDSAGVRLYAAIDGYGVFTTAAPHRRWDLRVVSTADFAPHAAAPGALLSVIGSRVSAARGDNLNYPVLSASDSESQIQVPFEAAGPNVALSLQTNTGSVTVGLPVASAAPAIFVSSDGTPMIYDADTDLPLNAQNTAHSNGRLKILATGLGKVRPEWPTNLPAPERNPPKVIAPVQVFLDGTPLEVTSATLAPLNIGFYVIEAQLPSITNLGTSELHVAADGRESNHVQIVVEP
ncbi:MAG: hypothetical protein JO336_13650 [Acidobacteriia bacterium]|nr:hypothetical protein [Terriglobia bacterium]